MRVKKKSPGQSSTRATIKVFGQTKDLLEDLKKTLQVEFEAWAKKSGIKVKRGKKGNAPTLANAAGLIALHWGALPKDIRSERIRQYIIGFYGQEGT